MKKLNWIFECLISMVTCGLYGIFYAYKVDLNMRTLNPYPSKQVLNFWLALLLGIITGGIVWIVYYYQLFTALEEEAVKLGIKKFYNPIISVLITLIPFYSFYYLCDYENTVAEAKGMLQG